jgi:multiple sugar transport system substrate-binding protein
MVRKHLKILGLALLAGGAGYLLFGTGNAGSGDQVTVSFWGAYEEWYMWQRIVAAYEDQTGERVRMEYWPARYEDKVKIRLASGTPPDVMLFQDEPFPPFCQFGKFEDLTAYLRTPGYELDLDRDYWPTSVVSFKYRGRPYGLPVWGGNNLIYINKALFNRLGVPYPGDDWTIDDFLATCQRLTGDDDGDGRIDHYGFSSPYWLYMLPFAYACGARLLDSDGRHFPDPDRPQWAFTGPEALAFLRLCQDLRWKYHVSPRAGEAGQTDEQVLFLTGRTGMFTSGPWAMPFLNRTDLDWDVVHVPRGPGGRGTRVTWDSLIMARDSPRKQAAWRFMHFCVSRRAQEIVARAQRSVPALMAAQDIFVAANPRVHVGRFIEAMQYANLQPITDRWEKMAVEFGAEFDRLIDNSQTPEDTMNRLAERQRRLFPPKEAGP